MLISIITITKNAEKTLERTIESVLSQTFKDIEYIIIDGDSTDNTKNIINKYKEKIAYYLSERDSGISDAFNKGITRATGTIVHILNADDWLEKDALKKIALFYASNLDAEIICSKVQLWRQNKPSLIITTHPQKFEILASIAHPGIFVQKKVYQEIGGYSLDMKYAMDYDFLLRAKRLGRSFASLNEVLVNMQCDGISDKNWLRGKLEVWKAMSVHQPNKILNNFLFMIFQLSKGALSRLLNRLGCDKLLEIYHSCLIKNSR